MGFWIYMLLMDLLLPLVMIGVGKWFMTKPPAKINALFGYRTAMSMKNKDTWEFAHKYCGKLWLGCGCVLLPISAVPLLFVLGRETDVVGIVGAVVCAVQIAPLIGTIFSTEAALKRTFDENGMRR